MTNGGKIVKGPKVLTARHTDGRPVSKDQYEKDWPQIVKEHAKAKSEHPTWGAFGGLIRIGDREYQVA